MRTTALYLCLAVSMLVGSQAQAQGPLSTAFTYQGQLATAGGPATGTYDMRFRLGADRQHAVL